MFQLFGRRRNTSDGYVVLSACRLTYQPLHTPNHATTAPPPPQINAIMPFSCFCIECVDTASVGIVERLGNFTGVLSPGLNLIAWPLDSVVGRVSGRIQQFACDCATKVQRWLGQVDVCEGGGFGWIWSVFESHGPKRRLEPSPLLSYTLPFTQTPQNTCRHVTTSSS